MDPALIETLTPFIGCPMLLATTGPSYESNKLKMLKCTFNGVRIGPAQRNTGNYTYETTVTISALVHRPKGGQSMSEFHLFDHPKMLELSTFDGSTYAELRGQRLEIGKRFSDSLLSAPSDFIIKSEDGGSIAVHRLILSARSPKFAQMFMTDMKERNSGELLIKGYSTEALEVFVHAIYNKLHPKMGDHLGSLVALIHENDAGHPFDFVPKSHFAGLIKTENAAELQFLGVKLGYSDITALASVFIRNHKEAVMATDGWKEWVQGGMALDAAAWAALL